MPLPMLQVALDHTNLPDALAAARAAGPHVDVIEAGTILCFAVGVPVVGQLRSIADGKKLVADLKIVDAGETLARLAFEAGADWVTAMCAAPTATIQAVHAVAAAHRGEAQIELFGRWTPDDAREWVKIGVRQAIFHRGRDAQAGGQGWSAADIDQMKQLSDLGLELSVTGGVTPDQISLFRDVAVKTFIVGRAIYATPDPAGAAVRFRQAITAVWG